MRKDLLVNSLGIGGGQAVVLLATPFLARVYSPQEFGVYASIVAVASILSTVASLRFDAAIPSIPSADVRPLFHFALILSFVVSGSVVGSIALLSMSLTAVANVIAVPLHWVGAIGALSSAANVCQARFTRWGAFRWSATLKVVQPVIFVATALATVAGLNGALTISWVMVIAVALWGCRCEFSSFNAESCWNAAKKARKYPLLSLPTALLDAASLSLPLLFIVTAFGSESAGHYSQVQRLVGAPLMLLGIATSQVFYKHAGDLQRSGRPIEPLLWRVVLSLFGIAVVVILSISLVGEPVLRLVLGEKWRTDIQFQFLAIAPVVFRMIVSPVSSVFLVTNRIGLGSAWQAMYFAATISVILIAYHRLDLDEYLLVVALSELIMYVLYLAMAVISARSSVTTASV